MQTKSSISEWSHCVRGPILEDSVNISVFGSLRSVVGTSRAKGKSFCGAEGETEYVAFFFSAVSLERWASRNVCVFFHFLWKQYLFVARAAGTSYRTIPATLLFSIKFCSTKDAILLNVINTWCSPNSCNFGAKRTGKKISATIPPKKIRVRYVHHRDQPLTSRDSNPGPR